MLPACLGPLCDRLCQTDWGRRGKNIWVNSARQPLMSVRARVSMLGMWNDITCYMSWRSTGLYCQARHSINCPLYENVILLEDSRCWDASDKDALQYQIKGEWVYIILLAIVDMIETNSGGNLCASHDVGAAAEVPSVKVKLPVDSSVSLDQKKVHAKCKAKAK